MLAFVILDRNLRLGIVDVVPGALESEACRASQARCQRRVVEGVVSKVCARIRERVRVGRQRERRNESRDGKVEQLGVVHGLSW